MSLPELLTWPPARVLLPEVARTKRRRPSSVQEQRILYSIREGRGVGMYFRYTALLQGGGRGCFKGFQWGRGWSSPGSVQLRLQSLLRLRWQLPGQCPCTPTSTTVLNWGVPLSWGVRAQPSHMARPIQYCKVISLQLK